MDIKTSHAIQDQQYFTIYTHMLLCVSSRLRWIWIPVPVGLGAQQGEKSAPSLQYDDVIWSFSQFSADVAHVSYNHLL